jgi:hypothetical protein
VHSNISKLSGLPESSPFCTYAETIANFFLAQAVFEEEAGKSEIGGVVRVEGKCFP